VNEEQKTKQRKAQLAMNDFKRKYKLDKDSMVLNYASNMRPAPKLKTGILSLDVATGGGFDYGRFTTIFGPMATAKSTICGMLIANAQADGKVATLIDSENRFDPVWASKLGVNIDELLVPDLPADITAEKVLDLYIALADAGASDLIIIDSISALSPREEMEKTLEEGSMALTARAMSRFFRKVGATNKKHDVCGVLVGQLGSSMEKYAAVIDGLTCGNAIKSHSHYIISASRKQPQSANLVTKEEGFVLTLNLLKAPGIEGLKIECEFRKNEGIDLLTDKVNICIANNIIEYIGTSYVIDDKKFRGVRSLTEAIKFSEELQKYLDGKIEERYLEGKLLSINQTVSKRTTENEEDIINSIILDVNELPDKEQ
jgi:recombination protein RecA